MHGRDRVSAQFEYYALNAILIAAARDPESADITCGGNMCAGTQAFVIISDLNYSHGFGCVFRKSAEIESFHRLFLCYVFFGYSHILTDYTVDLILKTP